MLKKTVVILSVPYCEPYPMVAPALLSSCLTKEGIPSIGIDFNIKFVEEFSKCHDWSKLKLFFTLGYFERNYFPKRLLVKIFKFTKNFIFDLVTRYNPLYIGLSVFTSESLDFSLIMSYIIRKYFPKIKIIAGGKGLEVLSGVNNEYHYKNYIKYNIVDTVIVGDAENEIISAIKNNKVGIVYAIPQTAKELNQIPYPSWDGYNFNLYALLQNQRDRVDTRQDSMFLTVTGSKGCVKKCKFCDVSEFWNKYIYKDPSKVAGEIIQGYRNTGITYFKFTDNIINGSIVHYRTLNQILSDEIPNTIKYSGYAIFRGKSHMPESDFKLAAKAGCDLWAVGIESGSEKIRYDMGKKFSDDDLDWSVNQLFNNGINQTWLLMVGYPSETDVDFSKTLKLLEKYSMLLSRISIGITPTFSLLSNSPLIRNDLYRKEYGLEHNLNNDIYAQKFWTSTVHTDNTFLVRANRWKVLINLVNEIGYEFSAGLPIQKWTHEIDALIQIYNERHFKI